MTPEKYSYGITKVNHKHTFWHGNVVNFDEGIASETSGSSRIRSILRWWKCRM